MWKIKKNNLKTFILPIVNPCVKSIITIYTKSNKKLKFRKIRFALRCKNPKTKIFVTKEK